MGSGKQGILRSLAHVALALLLLVQAALFAESAETKNTVVNGDFSQTEKGKPVGWAAYGDQNVAQTLEVVSDEGNPCARLVCTRFAKKTGASHAMIAQVGLVTLEKGKYYEFSCRARAEDMRGRTISVAISDMDGWESCGLSGDFRLDKSWRSLRRVFRATRSVSKTSRLQLWFSETGTLYLDDIQLTEISVQGVEFTDVVPATGAKNLLPNGSFEVGPVGWSSLGKGAGWGNLARLHGRIETSGGTHGRSFLRIPLGGDDTPVLYFDYLRPVVRREVQTLAASCGWIPVEKGAPYTISCDMRASVDGAPAVLGVRAKDASESGHGGDQRQKVALAKSWKRYSFTFHPTRRYVYVTVGPDLDQETRVDVDIDAVQLEKGEQATVFEARSPIEIGIEPSAPGGVFTQGEPAFLHLRAYSSGSSVGKVRIDFECSDYFDKSVALPSVSFEIPARTMVERKMALPSDWKGYYRVQAKCAVNGSTESRVLRLAIVPRRSTNDSILGINHAFVTSDLIQQAKKAGVTWYRDWSLKWQDLEPSPGEFRWEVGDAQIDRVVKEGVKLMALMPPFPSSQWASEASPDLPSKGYPGERLREAWAPKDPQKLGDFVASVVGRYRNRIQIWEFLNEPIYTDYALPGERHSGKYPGKTYSIADYVGLLKIAAAGMRKGDPKCKVMGGIGSPPNLLNREVIEADCLQQMDIFNLHMYPGSRLPESYLPEMDTLLDIMEKQGGRKPIWITEFSYYGADDLPRRPFIPSGSWSEDRLLGSERECAELTIRYFAVMLARGVEKIFLHSGASGTVNESNFECCMFDYGGVPRKVLSALAVFTELMGPKPKYAAEKSFGEDGYCFAFETGKQAVLVLWTTNGGVRQTVAVPSAARECLDVVGRTISMRPIALSTSPVYILGPAGTAKELTGSLKLAEIGL